MRRFYIGLCIGLLLLFSLCGDAAMRGAAGGLDLFGRGVLPALLPFSVCIGCLKRLGFFEAGKPAGFFGLLRLLLLGAAAGNPSGSMLMNASLSASNAHNLSIEESVYSALFNLASPVFITGAVCSRIFRFQTAKPALLMLVCHYGASLLLFCIFFFASKTRKGSRKTVQAEMRSTPVPHPAPSLIAALPGALSDAAATMLKLCAAMVFFVSLSEPIAASSAASALPSEARALIIGALEMTNGVSMLASAAIGLRLKLALACAIISFGGVCIFIQANAISPVKASVYLLTKLFHGALAFMLCLLMFPLFFRGSVSVFSSIGAMRFAHRALSALQIAFLCLIGSVAASLAAVFAAGKTRG